MSTLIIPPVSTSLEDMQSVAARGETAPTTEKAWYLYWQRVGEQVIANTRKLAGLVTYGAHADRPAKAPEGALYIEIDRSGVIYQMQAGAWHFIAGTMWGTVSPDERPTDLGVNDSGFDFRGTDEAREFIWSGTAWIEATAVTYGTHAARPAAAAAADGVLYVETDRSNVIYQQQGGAWVYVAGVMRGTLTPDQRPTGLGTDDEGFTFRATDEPREFIWDGAAWDEISAASGAMVYAASTGSLGLTTTMQDIPGATVTLPRAGVYYLSGVIDFILLGAGDGDQTLLAQVVANGSALGQLAIFRAPAPTCRFTVAQQWMYTAGAAGQIAKLQANKSGGTGGSIAAAGHSTLAAVWISP